ncbi:hypothetical protein SAMN04488498_12829 [Mesorhizobium albiziae]|uniref:Uncharacterized protein n=2 Tax=Neomesorhizobium albiziae TaxID=335020 RepID=A0A1I4EP93_9HYPH|nr:hypothetical protein SAMN04488498_12829 [Mesorhizobium albiziae]
MNAQARKLSDAELIEIAHLDEATFALIARAELQRRNTWFSDTTLIVAMISMVFAAIALLL